MRDETPGKVLEIVITDGERRQGRLRPEHFRLAGLLLHTRGHVTLKQALPVDLVEEAAAAFARIYQDCVASKRGDGWYQVGQASGAVFWERQCRWRIFPKLHHPFDQPALLANPLAMQLCEFLLGDDFYCKFVSSDTCVRGAALQAPHRELGIGQAWAPQAYIVNVPLGHCGLDNGPLEIWPGAGHLWQNALLDRLGLDTDVQDGVNPAAAELASFFPSRRLVLEPGDLLIRDPGLLHRGTENHTDMPRFMLTLCYFRQGRHHDYGQAAYNLDRTMWLQLHPDCRRRFAHAFEPRPLAAESPRRGQLWKRLLRPWSRSA